MTLLLLLCSHSPNDVPSTIAAVRGAVRPAKNDTVEVNPPYIGPSLSFRMWCSSIRAIKFQ